MESPMPDIADYVGIVFDGPPSPTGGRFVEVEDAHGRSIRFGPSAKAAIGLCGFGAKISAD
jgi:hypothetical protein